MGRPSHLFLSRVSFSLLASACFVFESECVCVCVCVCERERERESVCVSESVSEREWEGSKKAVASPSRDGLLNIFRRLF